MSHLGVLQPPLQGLHLLVMIGPVAAKNAISQATISCSSGIVAQKLMEVSFATADCIDASIPFCPCR